MNAKSERASLPDRVEAAARALMYETKEQVEAWKFASEDERQQALDIARSVLAAADACEASRTSDDGHEAEASMSDHRIAAEAERNPNTTDEYEPRPVD